MWNTLDEKQKIEYKKYCDSNYGKTMVGCETGEPMYIDKQGNLIDTKIIIELLFSSQKN
jgi:hypothetical protein